MHVILLMQNPYTFRLVFCPLNMETILRKLCYTTRKGIVFQLAIYSIVRIVECILGGSLSEGNIQILCFVASLTNFIFITVWFPKNT